MNGKANEKKESSGNRLVTRLKQSLVVIIGLFISLAVLLFGFIVQNNYNASLYTRDVEAARAHTWTRYLAILFEKETDLSALQERLPLLVQELKQTDPRIMDIQVLKGTTFLFHPDPTKINQGVNPENPEDKKIFDDSTQIKFRLKKKNVNENFLLRADTDNNILTLIEPIIKKRSAAGVIKLDYQYFPTVNTGFGWLILLAISLFLIAVFLFTRIQSKRLQWGIALPMVLFFMIAGLFIFSHNADSLRTDAINKKVNHLQYVLNKINTQTPGHLETYITDIKKGQVSGFFPEFASLQLINTVDTIPEPGTGTFFRINLSAETGKSVQIALDSAQMDATRKVFNKRTRTVSIVFLVIAYMVLIFILAGYAFRTLCALKKHYYSYIYIFPSMVGMIVLVLFPFVWGTTMGFFKITHTSWDFVGLQNFADILSDFHPFTPGNFYFTLLVTIMWTVINVALHVAIGMILALILNRPATRNKKIYRVLLILPWAIPNYITALIWKGMFHKQFGAINAFLQVIGIEPVSWFNHFWTAFFANVATNTWLGFPFMMVISLGALQSIPADLYEAAEVDGASRWQQFKHITLPLLKPALFPAIILGTIWTFNMFNIIYLVSNGAPNRATDILITQAYRFAFENFNWGFAAAYSIIIFAILLAYGTFSNRATRATEGVFD